MPKSHRNKESGEVKIRVMSGLMRKEILPLIIFLLLGVVLRFYKLGQVPAGFFSDEAAVGYNAYSLLETGKDEFGKTWPFFFTSFGEGKLPLYVYQALPSVAIFGLNEFASRFPGAFFGSLTIVVLYFFTKEVLAWVLVKPRDKFEQLLSAWLPLFSSLVLALMPWHIHFSRGVFGQESLFWMTSGVWLSLFSVRKGALHCWFFSSLCFTAGLLTYHAARVFVPIWIICLLLGSYKKLGIKKTITHLVIFLVFTGSIWVFIFLSPLGMARAEGVSVFSQQSGVKARLETSLIEPRNQPLFITRMLHNKVESFGRDIFSRYVSHFNPDFLFITGDPLRPRYRAPEVAQLLLIMLPFYLVGLYFLVNKKLWPVLVFLLLAPLPAALSFETPSSVRAIYMVVPLSVVVALGGLWFIFRLNKWQFLFKRVVWLILLAGLVYNLGFYLDAYYVHAPVRQPYYWQYGYKDLVKRVRALMPFYARAKITDQRGTPYIFFLFYGKYDPKMWQSQVEGAIEPAKAFNFLAIRRMDNLEFIADPCPAQLPEDDVLYVCTEEKHPEELIKTGVVKIIDTIPFQDGQPAFVLMEKVKGAKIPENLL